MRLCDLDEIEKNIKEDKKCGISLTDDSLETTLEATTILEMKPVVTCYNCRFFRNREQECSLFNRKTTNADFCSKGQ